MIGFTSFIHAIRAVTHDKATNMKTCPESLLRLDKSLLIIEFSISLWRDMDFVFFRRKKMTDEWRAQSSFRYP